MGINDDLMFIEAPLKAIDEAERDIYASPWGNRIFTITPELLRQLQEGRLVTEHPFDEYGYFIRLAK